MSALGRAWRWVVGAVALLPVAGWIVAAWLGERHRRIRAEEAAEDLGRARDEAERERQAIHEAYHRDAEAIARARGRLEATPDADLAAAWRRAFSGLDDGADQ